MYTHARKYIYMCMLLWHMHLAHTCIFLTAMNFIYDMRS